MKRIEIIGDNYIGKWDKTRTACRAVVIRDGKLLLSYETKNDQWMIPGGGLEDGESKEACVVRELAEETGLLIKPSSCVLEIDEFYGNWKYVSLYFPAEVTGTTQRNLTEREKEVGMEPRCLELDKIIEIFSKHQEYADINEMRRGMYLREYTALTAYLQ